jgi:hypothetical protein
MCAELVQVRVKGSVEVANLEEISGSGACLQFDRAVDEGVDIEIQCQESRLKGTVRHCRYTGIGYDIGVQFDEPGSWTRERFEPEYLLDIVEFERRALGRK